MNKRQNNSARALVLQATLSLVLLFLGSIFFALLFAAPQAGNPEFETSPRRVLPNGGLGSKVQGASPDFTFAPGPTETPTPSQACGTFANPTSIAIPFTTGISSPYPSDIAVSGLGGSITKVTVAISGLNHASPADIDALLTGPGGQSAIIMSDAGANFSVTAVNLVLDDSAANPLSNGPQLVSGTYQPTNIGECVFNGTFFSPIDEFPAPAPAPTPAGSSALSVFNGTNPNGTWSLYVFNDGGGTGNFSGGWSVTIATNNCAGPTATPQPTPTPGGTTHFGLVAPGSCANGQPCIFTVTALDEANNIVPSYSGTVHFTSSDRFGPQLPGDSQLINGSGTFGAGLNNLFGHDSITATDTSDPTITGTSNCILVLPPTPPTPSPTPTSTPTPPALTPTPTPAPGPTPPKHGITLLYQNFDFTTPPALPTGWSSSFAPGPADCSGQGSCAFGTNWINSLSNPYTGPSSAFHDAPACVTDSSLDTPSFDFPNFPNLEDVTLGFQHSFDFENGRDGGVLEISYDGGCFRDIRDVGGTVNYNGTISTGFLSPIAGRDAWTGNSGGYVPGLASLPASAKGHQVTLRFRLATDCSGSGAGWNIDVVWVTGHFSGLGTPAPTPLPTATPSPPATACTIGEGFDVVGPSSPAGWVKQNNSVQFRLTDWSNGDPARFPAQTGAPNSYVAASSSVGCGTISNWLLTPPITLVAGGVLTFWTRTVDTPTHPDRLQVRMSTNGTGTNVGSNATGVGDFTALLLDINPTYTTSGYPNGWTQYTIVLSGLPSPVTGRLAFRYFVENGGPNGINSDYIGIDTVSYTCVVSTPTPTATPCSGAGATPCPPPPTATPPPATHFAVSAPGVWPLNWTFQFTVTALDKFNNIATDYSRIVHFTSSANLAGLPSDSTLVNGVGTFNASLGSKGPQTITATDTGDPFLNGTSNLIFIYDEVPPTPTPTPAVGDIILVSRLSDATAYARNLAGSDDPPPQVQNDFLPAHLSNSAKWSGESGEAHGQSTSNSAIVLDNSMGTLRVTGDGAAQSSAILQDAQASASAKVIVLNFTLADRTYAYSLTGQLTGVFGSDCISCSGIANARLVGSSTIFEVAAGNQENIPPSAALSESGVLPPGSYTLSIDVNTVVIRGDNFSSIGIESGANFIFALDPTPTPAPATHAINLSTRLVVGTGNEVGIGGFIITGPDPKQVVLRGIGPSLGNFGVPNPLANPVLELHGPGTFVTITNDNWKDTQQAAIEATGIPPSNDLESAILVTLDPGSYTAILSGNNNGTGVGLVEIYDLSQGDSSKMANISTRAFVSSGNDIVIAGFILGGGSNDDLIVVRGIGPSLTDFGVPNALANPYLELRNGEGALVIANDDWQSAPPGPPFSLPPVLAPSHALESAMAALLPPGAYTALLSGVNNGTGVGLVEVYDLGMLSYRR